MYAALLMYALASLAHVLSQSGSPSTRSFTSSFK